ncbi:MAG TPA: DNA recombination protein RmuC, partial [Mycobacteriales bacterium]|nr:DNA recombination protein RmuC [Mycobacteriales bacterium]
LKESFQALSHQALEANSKQFLEVAQATLRAAQTESQADLDQRRQAVEHLVAPMKESLSKVETQLQQIEVAREGAYQGLMAQVADMRQTSADLRKETGALVTALRKPQVRGQWGEMHLRRAVELAGMVEHCDFTEQATTTTSDGRVRPDLVVQLAGGKHLVVDAKVPLAAYLDAAEATDDAVREARLKDHARQLRTHVDALAGKAYWDHVETTPDFVVLFVPGDSFLAAALDADPSLYEHAATKQVILTTPSTLIGLLRTVAHTWRQEALAANAREVCELGRELYRRLATMGGHVEALGKSLERAVGQYNKTVGSFETSVLPQARRFRDLKVSEADLAELVGVSDQPRQLVAPELVASAAESRPVVAVPAGEPAFELDGELRRAAGLA